MRSLWLACMLLPLLTLCAQEQDPDAQSKPLREYVAVTNVELVLRVIEDGRTQGGFRKEDFRLLENGRERPINGFFELKKSMNLPKASRDAAEPEGGRLFLLLFWTTQVQTEVEAHLDEFFRQVYRPGDRVILSADQIQMEISEPSQAEAVRRDFLVRLGQEMDRKQEKWRALHRDLSFSIDLLLRDTRLNKDAAEVKTALVTFAKDYERFMKEIDFMNRSVDFDQMERMCAELGRIKVPKWALVFFEAERIPTVDANSLRSEVEKGLIIDDVGTMIDEWYNWLTKIEMVMAQLGGRYNLFERLRSRFIQADAVFHLLQLSSATTITAKTADRDELLDFRPMSSSWETILQEISRNTGGQITRIDKDPAALQPLFELEDVSYLLTYVPGADLGPERKIELAWRQEPAKDRNCRLLYGKRLEMERTPAVHIDHISHFQESLNLACSGYYLIYTNQGPRGHLQVRVDGQSAGREPVTLFAGDVDCLGSFQIALGFPHEGEWKINVQVSDAMTRLHDQKSLVVQYRRIDRIATTAVADTEAELGPLLEKCAAYAEKLKKTAIRFFCSEKVTEKVGTAIKTGHFKKWKYDYQIVLQNENLMESRRENKGKNSPETATLKTLYKSHYSFFLPVTFLSADRQPAYRYAFMDRNRSRKNSLVRISARPKDANSPLPAGELWIDESDGSVLQIVLDPKTLTGFQERYRLAEQKRMIITITDTHRYDRTFNGMRFPTSTFISEHRVSQDASNNGRTTTNLYTAHVNEPVLYTVHFQYEDFRFFDIASDEKITGWIEE